MVTFSKENLFYSKEAIAPQTMITRHSQDSKGYVSIFEEGHRGFICNERASKTPRNTNKKTGSEEPSKKDHRPYPLRRQLRE